MAKLLSKGGQGCIFYPEIPCKGNKYNKKSKNISKISFNDESAEREFKINLLIKKIDNYKEWCILWNKICSTDKYEKLKEYTDIEKCIYLENIKRKKKSKSKLSTRSNFKVLKGPYGGESCVDLFEKIFDKETLTTKYKFIKAFTTIMKNMEPLFLGILELMNNKISHHDINNRNILFEDNKIKLIDFGLAVKYTEVKRIKKRMGFIFNNDKLYESYSWDYTLLYATLNNESISKLTEELKDIDNDIFRDGSEELEKVYNLLMMKDYKSEVKCLIQDILDGKFKPSLNLCLSKLDVYSLGIMIPTVLIRQITYHKVPIKDILKVIDSEEVKPYFDLFRDMTYLRCTSRISANLAYDRYKNL